MRSGVYTEQSSRQALFGKALEQEIAEHSNLERNVLRGGIDDVQRIARSMVFGHHPLEPAALHYCCTHHLGQKSNADPRDRSVPCECQVVGRDRTADLYIDLALGAKQPPTTLAIARMEEHTGVVGEILGSLRRARAGEIVRRRVETECRIL